MLRQCGRGVGEVAHGCVCWYVGMGAGTQLRAHWSEVGIRVSEGCGGSADSGVGVVPVCGVLARCAIGSDGCRVVIRRHALLRLA